MSSWHLIASIQLILPATVVLWAPRSQVRSVRHTISMDLSQISAWDYICTSPHLSPRGIAACNPSSSLARNFPLLEVFAWVDASTRSPLFFSNCGYSITFWDCSRGCMLIGSLSTTKSLTSTLLLKAFHASCTSIHVDSWLAHIAIVSPSQNFLTKELILNRRYLPHLSSDSTNFIFQFGYFYARNPKMLFFSETILPKISDILCKLARPKIPALIPCRKSITQLWYHIEISIQ